MELIVQKFGGSTLADINRIKHIAERIKELKDQKKSVIIVVSAMGKTTDQLISNSLDLSEHPPQREVDVLLSTGEMISAAYLAIALNQLNCPAISFTGAQAGIYTDEIHSNANIKLIEGTRISNSINEGKVVILTGFQGVDHNGDTTTLGRGGSDITAMAVAAQFKASRCEILKDFPAIYSVDPQMIEHASPLPHINYDQLLEMTFWGAQVLQYRSVEIAKHFKVPLYIGPAHSKEKGTIVEDIHMIENSEVLALNSHKNVLKIHSPLESLSEAIEWFRNILSIKNISFPQLLHTEKLRNGIDLFITAPIECLGSIANEMRIESYEQEGLCSVTTTCRGSTSPELLEKIICLLENKEIKILYMSISAMSVTVFIRPDLRMKAIEALYQCVPRSLV